MAEGEFERLAITKQKEKMKELVNIRSTLALLVASLLLKGTETGVLLTHKNTLSSW